MIKLDVPVVVLDPGLNGMPSHVQELSSTVDSIPTVQILQISTSHSKVQMYIWTS